MSHSVANTVAHFDITPAVRVPAIGISVGPSKSTLAPLLESTLQRMMGGCKFCVIGKTVPCHLCESSYQNAYVMHGFERIDSTLDGGNPVHPKVTKFKHSAPHLETPWAYKPFTFILPGAEASSALSLSGEDVATPDSDMPGLSSCNGTPTPCTPGADNHMDEYFNRPIAQEVLLVDAQSAKQFAIDVNFRINVAKSCITYLDRNIQVLHFKAHDTKESGNAHLLAQELARCVADKAIQEMNLFVLNNMLEAYVLQAKAIRDGMPVEWSTDCSSWVSQRGMICNSSKAVEDIVPTLDDYEAMVSVEDWTHLGRTDLADEQFYSNTCDRGNPVTMPADHMDIFVAEPVAPQAISIAKPVAPQAISMAKPVAPQVVSRPPLARKDSWFNKPFGSGTSLPHPSSLKSSGYKEPVGIWASPASGLPKSPVNNPITKWSPKDYNDDDDVDILSTPLSELDGLDLPYDGGAAVWNDGTMAVQSSAIPASGTFSSSAWGI